MESVWVFKLGIRILMKSISNIFDLIMTFANVETSSFFSNFNLEMFLRNILSHFLSLNIAVCCYICSLSSCVISDGERTEVIAYVRYEV